jgi:hypothetical protein
MRFFGHLAKLIMVASQNEGSDNNYKINMILAI